MRKNLLVCSVFCGSGNYNSIWLRLQFNYLKRTIGSDFDHAVYLNGADASLFSQSVIIGQSNTEGGGLGHLRGLNAIADYCRSHDYEHYLVIDSDCFPIANDWLKTIAGTLRRMDKRYAAPLRVENLDTFPHPSVFFTSDPEYILFDFAPGTNLLGREINDIACIADRKDWLPLFRTNRVSRHPTIGSVYYDCFYHHGCGSRNFQMRAVIMGYYDSIISNYPSFEMLTEELFANPDAYLRFLQFASTHGVPGVDPFRADSEEGGRGKAMIDEEQVDEEEQPEATRPRLKNEDGMKRTWVVLSACWVGFLLLFPLGAILQRGPNPLTEHTVGFLAAAIIPPALGYLCLFRVIPWIIEGFRNGR